MFPDLWVQETANGPLAFHTYGLFLTLGFLAAALVAGARMKKVGMNPDKLVPLIAIAIVSGILGARLLHFLGSERAAFLANPLLVFDLRQGGMAFYGGAIAASIASLLYVRSIGLSVWKMADVGVPCILLGLAIGRLGCFSAGCCHGAACPVDVDMISLTGGLFPGGEVVLVHHFPYVALVFKAGVGVGNLPDQALYPTQLWEAVGAFTLFGLLSWIWRKYRYFDGQVLALTLLTYPPLRATIEGFRGDTVRGVEHVGHLSTSQLTSIPVFVVGLAILLLRFRSGVAPEKPYEVAEASLFDDDAAG